MMKPTGGARVAVTEGEGVVTGLCKLEEETAFGKYAKAAQAGMGRACARGLRKKKGEASGPGWAEMSDGPTGRWADLPKVKEKFFSE
jgi:hypothetical protein